MKIYLKYHPATRNNSPKSLFTIEGTELDRFMEVALDEARLCNVFSAPSPSSQKPGEVQRI